MVPLDIHECRRYPIQECGRIDILTGTKRIVLVMVVVTTLAEIPNMYDYVRTAFGLGVGVADNPLVHPFNRLERTIAYRACSLGIQMPV
jgi:hypothetical protein